MWPHHTNTTPTPQPHHTHTHTTPTPHQHHTNTTPTPHPHHTQKSCGVDPHHNFFQKVWCWCGVGVVWVWFGRRLSVVCHRTIANRTYVSFCNLNQPRPKAKFGYLTTHESCGHAGMSLPHPFCGWKHLAKSGESNAHFGLPWVRPWDNRGKCHMDEKRI